MIPAVCRFPQAPQLDITSVRELISADMDAVNRMIRERLHSDVVLVNQLGHYIVNSGGKRLRPSLALLSAQAHSYQGQKHIAVAAIVEFIHTATLLHDDVVDSSSMRRGRLTANLVWGDEASVLVGDFLYSRAFQMMVEVSNMRVMEILADATNNIAEGEVMQLINCHDPDISEARYFEVIRNKTAKLFEAASRLGAVLGEADAETEEAMATYGRHLGTAFQLVDDLLDYSAAPADLGKNLGDDLAEGKATLPLLYSLWNSGPEQAQAIREAIEKGGLEHLDIITTAIESSGAIAYTAQAARAELKCALQALDTLEPSPHKSALVTLAKFSVDRKS